MFLLRYVCLETSKEGLCRDLEESEVGLDEWLLQLRKAGIEVSSAGSGIEVSSAGATVEGTLAGAGNIGEMTMPEAEGREAGRTLWITDDPFRAKELMDQGKPVLGLIADPFGEKAKGRSAKDQKSEYWRESEEVEFKGIPYLGYHLTEMEPQYLERVWRRQAGMPWEILETERCLVRETNLKDADAFYEIYGDGAVTEYLEKLPEDRNDFCAWLEIYQKQVYGLLGYGIWTVCLKPSEWSAKREVRGVEDAGKILVGDARWRVIGRAGLNVREGQEDPELGFVIGKTWQGRGYAFEVCSAILEYARDCGIQRVNAFAELENYASIALLQKLGFRNVGKKLVDGKRCLQFTFETS